ncbi:MAG: glycoside hydrolase family 3 C-terminal domain-containing protein [Melioribacteraceae bacterium]|nr:glycoside hydrolase family 3 C-terminal domain-containing protein [Melioribacteraceae bacterium]
MALQNNIVNEQTKLNYKYEPFIPPINFEEALNQAEKILSQMSLDEKILFVGGHNFFFIKGFEQYRIPQLYLADATSGVHIRKELSGLMEKSVAFPNPLALAATWNIELANQFAKCIGEECRIGDVAILLGPGMNIYRNSQCGRNFEYFGEDPFLAARMIENYVTGMQSTGTIATLKHFLVNNHEWHRRTTNVIIDERTLHEIYLPAFKAGIDAGAMAVMTSYNLVNGEWAGQSKKVIADLLKSKLGFKWLVMSDWWSTWDPEKTIKSGLDLEMPGDILNNSTFKKTGDITIKHNAKRLINESKVSEEDINRMAKNILCTIISMGLNKRPITGDKCIKNFPTHEKIALQTARESIVLLKNRNNILPINKNTKILLTGEFVEKIPFGGGSAAVEGYNHVLMIDSLKSEFGDNIEYIKDPSIDKIKEASIILLSTGTMDSEGWDRKFELPEKLEQQVKKISSLNKNTIVIINSGSGIKMIDWVENTAAILYAWYPGQTGYIALAEILSGKVNPSGKLPMTIEKNFEDSPAFGYIPQGENINTNWDDDFNVSFPIHNVEYKEGVFVGYRWYDSKKIEPLFYFGEGLSFTTFIYDNLNISKSIISGENIIAVDFTITNSGKTDGAEIAQLYISDIESSVPRPTKELKGFVKVFLKAGESKKVNITLTKKDFAFWDINLEDWKVEPGEFEICVGASSNDIRLTSKILFG